MKAVAIDLGASSARFALGELVGPWPESGTDTSATDSGTGPNIQFEIIEQVAHRPLVWNGHEAWDIEFLLDFCQKAVRYAKKTGAASVGIDTWGVDHGFINAQGQLIQPPICYRDASQMAMFERCQTHRSWLYQQTGIQHQPFNTIYQLLARKEEQPELFLPARPSVGASKEEMPQWLLLPDLLLFLLGGNRGYERSIASTTQLTDVNGDWNREVFERFALPLPPSPITAPNIAGEQDGVKLLRVGGHDTASAVEGMQLSSHSAGATAFANVGTWALVGTVRNNPDHSESAEKDHWTNERTPWNDVRFLANIPGFFLINRLHEELSIPIPIPQWIESSDVGTDVRIDLLAKELFAPESMAQAVGAQVGRHDLSPAELCGAALLSLAEKIAERVALLGATDLVLAGGASNSQVLRALIEQKTGIPLRSASAEATILGNLRTQFKLLSGRSSGLH